MNRPEMESTRGRKTTDRPVVQARGLCRTFKVGEEEVRVLQGVDLDLTAGESVAIMGRSGSGKSTLLHLLGLLDRPDEGTLEIEGRETTLLSRSERCRTRNREVGFVFQFYHLLPELDALHNAVLPRMIDVGPGRWARESGAAFKEAKSLLTDLGLEERLSHRPGQLSGGERQRVALARALVSRPSMLLCDEPTGNLDESTSEVIANQLFRLAREHGLTVVLVTHDALLAEQADRTLVLQQGVLTRPVKPLEWL